MTCSIDGCTRPEAARGWCATHYQRWRKHGDPLTCLRPLGTTEIGYTGAHDRVRAKYGKPAAHRCVRCSEVARHWAYDHADTDERFGSGRDAGKPYSTDPDHYMPLCAPCHKRFDLDYIKETA